ncbi:helix-turn-helix transcriptional regulator [Streptomyces qinglanensis]|uniref:DNA-binding transcriptional regulator, XRE-family HTH domain n=1 Tax=Streptomyces qinglanensis TaxID=943816 RepID=A0A1H9U1I6_9ACTN|nr:helix-turn-helix transcriptional regulator [Streptomyces qinglanensis]SES02933.1 DNA-binding transcriptional regulator, XRE-family HTH domain [Streptomyces qinglanensis]
MTPAELQRITTARTLITKGEARQHRAARHLSLQDVADSIGISRSTIHRWETGTSIPSAANALRWADALGITEEDTCQAE